MQEVIMSKAYAVNANFQGARGFPVHRPRRVSRMLLVPWLSRPFKQSLLCLCGDEAGAGCKR